MTLNDDFPRAQRLIHDDPYLAPYLPAITRRMAHIRRTADRVTPTGGRLTDVAAGHEYFGLHRTKTGWTCREWAPNATAVYLIDDVTGWRPTPETAFTAIDAYGAWQLNLPPERLGHQGLYRLHLQWPGGSGDRIPAYARRVVQDSHTLIFNAQVWRPDTDFCWQHPDFRVPLRPPLIYEAHVGMAQENAGIGTYDEFRERILPRVVAGGYNTLQIMAIPEHPYYGSFGYHVSSFFAASSRFGTPESLKALIDAAHGQGLAVVMDLVHSHAVANEVEGLSRFDGTDHQFFHTGGKGWHPAWGSRCFDYAKPEVIHFLLSNCRYWLDEFHVDGFRFDGVTSMLYTHHGLGTAFTSYDDYFNDTVDEDALAYLALANRVIHDLRPDALVLAEDVSGMPGLARPWADGGIGFDYRFAMGVPDHWIRLTKDVRDEDWHMGGLWHELTNRRADERTIAYAESHDQALVGDKTLMFQMAGAAMYHHMRCSDANPIVDRAVALHKMIRMITLSAAGHGYLNFMGNEFGHPEWVDFPREGNNWSYHHARRQWHLVDDPDLKYAWLDAFDKALIHMADDRRLLQHGDLQHVLEHNADQVLAFCRAGLLCVFNFNPTQSFTDYPIPAMPGAYRILLDTDDPAFGGHGRNDPAVCHRSRPDGGGHHLRLYLPSRTGLILRSEAAPA